MLVCSVANQAMMTRSMRNHIVRSTVARYASGGIIGVLAGIAMVTIIATSTYVLLSGCFLVCYGGYTLFARAPCLPDLPPAFDVVIGLLSGFRRHPSIPKRPRCHLIWLQRDRSPRTTRDLPAFYPADAARRHLRPDHCGADPSGDVQFRAHMPVALVGTAIGLRLFSRVTAGQFKIAVSAMLIVSGTALLF